MTAPHRYRRRSMNQVDDPPHFRLKLTLPDGVVEIMTGWQLRPYAVHQPQNAVGVTQIPAAQRPVKRGWQDGIHSHRIGVHSGEGVKPASVHRRVGGKLAWKSSRKRNAKVHALDVEGLPATSRCNFELLTPGARY